MLAVGWLAGLKQVIRTKVTMQSDGYSSVGCIAQRYNVGLSRRTFPVLAVLRSTCSWRVTTYVGKKPSAAGQATNEATPTQSFILSRPINWVVSWYRMCAQVAPSGACFWCYGLVRLKRSLRAVCVGSLWPY